MHLQYFELRNYKIWEDVDNIIIMFYCRTHKMVQMINLKLCGNKNNQSYEMGENRARLALVKVKEGVQIICSHGMGL
jgi:hypothetical protein